MSANIIMPFSVLEHITPKLPQSRIELHVHLDGALRQETAWELLKAKGLPTPGNGSFRDFRKGVTVQEPYDLQHFLSSFPIFMPAIQGDLSAIKRISVEFCEDAAENGIMYVEARFCPHLMLSEKVPEVKARDVVKTVLEGFAEGEVKYNVKARVILCCINGLSHYSTEVLQLCEEFRNEGVVGIDIAGQEMAISDGGGAELYDADDKHIFDEARKLGIRRTVHAGEAGPAANVKVAIEEMHAERIGHGYRVLQDKAIYNQCVDAQIHFEACPMSSILTGAVSMADALAVKHPIVQFAQDNANFSINTDDPTVTGYWLDDEYRLLQTWGFTEVHFTRATINAAKACFLPNSEKRDLMKRVKQTFGVDTD